jgi:hypothetical protein
MLGVEIARVDYNDKDNCYTFILANYGHALVLFYHKDKCSLFVCPHDPTKKLNADQLVKSIAEEFRYEMRIEKTEFSEKVLNQTIDILT